MLAEEAGYHAAFIEAHEGKTLAELLLPALRQVLYALNLKENVSDKTRRALRVLRSFLGSLGLKAKASLGAMELELAIDPETGSADSGDFEADLSALLQAVERLPRTASAPLPCASTRSNTCTKRSLAR